MPEINSTPTSPLELQIQQQAIERQRAIATLLQKDSLSAPDGQMISGHYVAPSFTQYAGKLASGLIGADQQTAMDNRQLGLAKQYSDYQTALADQLINGKSTTTPATTPPAGPASISGDAGTSGIPSMPLGSGMYGAGSGDAAGATPQKLGKALMISNGTAPFSEPSATAPISTPAGAQTRAGGNPMFRGMSPQILSNFLQNPDSAFGKIAQTQIQANAKGMEPTEFIKTLRAAGIDENSPQGRQLLQANIEKSNYTPPTSLRPGGYAQYPNGKLTQLPQVPEGYQAVDDGQGGWRIAPVAGGIRAITESTGAKARGNAGYSTQKVWNERTGQFEYTTAANVADAANGGQAPRYIGQDLIEQLPTDVRAGILNNAKSDDGKFQLNYQLPNGRRISGLVDLNSAEGKGSAGGAFAAEPKLGEPAGATVMAQGNAKGYQELKTQAAGAADRINALDNILDLANGKTQYGPGTTARLEKLSHLNSFIPTQFGQFGNDDHKNAQIMQKYVSNLAGQYMKSLGGTGTDAQLSNSLKSIANPDMMNDAIKEVVPKLKALEAAVQAKANGYDAWLAKGNNVSNGHLYESQFRKVYDPRIFQLQQLSPAEQATYIGKLPSTEAKSLKMKLQALKEIGAL